MSLKRKEPNGEEDRLLDSIATSRKSLSVHKSPSKFQYAYSNNPPFLGPLLLLLGFLCCSSNLPSMGRGF